MTSALAGPLHCAKGMLRHEGPLAFYKGLSAPLCAQAVYKSVIFSTNALVLRVIAPDASAERPPSSSKVWLGGVVSGAVNSLVVTPVELVRNQLMMQVHDRRFAGPKSLLTHLWRTSSSSSHFVSRLYRGWPLALARDCSGVGLWLWGYHAARFAQQGDSGRKLELAELMAAGSFAGIMFWSVALPWDGLKTRTQCQPIDEPSHPWRELVRGFRPYRGYQVAFGRGIPGAAITLVTHHKILEALNG
mmetsp:Transcript_21478/g.61220  ORF Transcript_21478/g.61220 Transcript_21478/m.61220 type:complete len:246 (+) Transcript_21478:58-795(+)